MASAICAKCAPRRHGPWGLHRAAEPACYFELWVTPDNEIHALLDTDESVATPTEARRRIARILVDFEKTTDRSTLATPSVSVDAAFGSDWQSVPGFGPLTAPPHLLRPVGELVETALQHLSESP